MATEDGARDSRFLTSAPSGLVPATGLSQSLTEEKEIEVDHETLSASGREAGFDEEKGSTEEFIVNWEGSDDPKNPLNWSNLRRWNVVLIVAMIAFVPPFASSIFAPGIDQVMHEFNSNNDLLATLVVSRYMLGFATGPLVLSPMSELYGRTPVLNITNILHIVFTIACAVSSNLNMLIGFRFLAGCVGSTPITVGGGVINDIMRQEQRGKAMSIFVMGPVLGPSLGPVVGGYLAQAVGWRWVFWLLTILLGIVTVITLIFLKETFAPTLLDRKCKTLQRETGNQSWRSIMKSDLPARQLFRRAIVRPTKMLIFSPIVFGLALFMATIYGYLYLLFTTYSIVFQEQYGFSIGEVGLVYLGLGCGMIVSTFIVGLTLDKQMVRLTAKNGKAKPEYRLRYLIVGSPLIAMGLFIYGWTADQRIHWIVPILGTVPIGVGIQFVFTPLSTYLLDAFGMYAASAIAATTVFRSVFAAILPLGGPAMYDSLGLGWGNSLLGFVALVFSAVPLLFERLGEKLREGSKRSW